MGPMLRRVVLRTVPRFSRVSEASSRRWNSSQPERRKFTSSPTVLLLGASTLGAGGYYYFSASTSKPLGHNLPSLRIAREEDIRVESPVRPLTLAAANAKLREQAQRFAFESKDGQSGIIDVVRLASNNPVEDDWSVGVEAGVGGTKTVFAGVYDGHAGWATSTILRQSLIPYVSTYMSKLSSSSADATVEKAIQTAFEKLDDRIMAKTTALLNAGAPPGSPEVIAALPPAAAGSCAILSIYDPATSILRTACTGDSRAVLGSWSAEKKNYVAEALSDDQTGFNKDEWERIHKEHPDEEGILDPNSGRLLGIAVTRAFGDHRWKWSLEFLEKLQTNFFDVGPRPKYKSPPYMTARPEVTTRKVTTQDFVILASDGLWDHISTEDAVACVSQWLAVVRNEKKPEVPSAVPDAGLISEGGGWSTWKVTPEDILNEDLDSAAVCLVKNAFGGRRRDLFRGVMSAEGPGSRYVRDDITVQVIFFQDPKEKLN